MANGGALAVCTASVAPALGVWNIAIARGVGGKQPGPR